MKTFGGDRLKFFIVEEAEDNRLAKDIHQAKDIHRAEGILVVVASFQVEHNPVGVAMAFLGWLAHIDQLNHLRHHRLEPFEATIGISPVDKLEEHHIHLLQVVDSCQVVVGTNLVGKLVEELRNLLLLEVDILLENPHHYGALQLLLWW